MARTTEISLQESVTIQKQPLKFVKDKVYIAGALNHEDANGYINNLSRMIQYGEQVRKMGAIPLVPGNDFLSCLISGELSYEEVIESSLGLLDSANAMFLVPGWDESKGVAGEVDYALNHGIFLTESPVELQTFINRPKILCIIGESGTGKSYISEYIEDMYDIPMIKSYTTRKQRNDKDIGHTFLTDEEFDELPEEDMIAYTEWEGKRYCCLLGDVEEKNTYVIDESGYSMLKTNYGNLFNIRGLRVHRDELIRREEVGDERVDRDKGKFKLYAGDYDFKIYNNGSLLLLENEIERIARHFFEVV